MKEGSVPNECQSAIESGDTTSYYTIVTEKLTPTLVMYEPTVPCQSNVSAMYCKCSTKVVMKGTVN